MSEHPNHFLVRFLRRRHFGIAAVCMGLIFVVEGIFLYRYFYSSLIATKSLIELREQASLEELKIPLYKQLLKTYEKKQTMPPLDTKNLQDPFSTAPSSPSSPRG